MGSVYVFLKQLIEKQGKLWAASLRTVLRYRGQPCTEREFNYSGRQVKKKSGGRDISSPDRKPGRTAISCFAKSLLDLVAVSTAQHKNYEPSVRRDEITPSHRPVQNNDYYFRLAVLLGYRLDKYLDEVSWETDFILLIRLFLSSKQQSHIRCCQNLFWW